MRMPKLPSFGPASFGAASRGASLRACLRDARGTAGIELAVILPLIALFMVNIIDVSSVVVRRIQMQKAVNTSLEMVVANPLPVNRTTALPDTSTLHTQTAQLAGVDEDKVKVEMWLECDGVEAPAFDDECAAHEVLARYLQVQVNDRYVPMFSISALGLIDDMLAISAEGALRVQ